MFGLLLENVGVDAVVRLGNPQDRHLTITHQTQG
jgi:hypothetical protein